MSGTLPESIEPKLSIVLVGLTGDGRTSVMNTLLGKEDQKHGPSASSQTTECKMETVQRGDQELVIIDTPGVLNTKKTEEEVTKDIVESIAHAALDGGPHVFLLVMRAKRFSEKDKEAVEIIQKIFGDGFEDYTLVLFTYGGELVPTYKDVEKFEFLKKFIHGEHSVHSFENGCKNVKCEEKEKQVSELMKKINKMVENNRKRNWPRYTSEMLKKAQEIQKEMEKSEPNSMKEDIVCKTVEKFVTGVVGEPLVGLVFGIVKFAMEKVAKCV
ncbi:GTPase IMAP family member 7-like [Perca fluviatilis]|uniref:GTPase IMAP family member 7-like n=1 Tax=Perca fluviatilis TaxID=8168 RepID=UPI001964ED16|nr:GTPase IMAP family member 7-like [Perca fluviatilis]